VLASPTAQAKRRVLVVDDSRFVRTTFATILRGSFDVREEADGEAAWAVIQSDASIVMVFTDLDMPKLNGFGLLSRIRDAKEERIRDLPVVVISGVDEPGWKESRKRLAPTTSSASRPMPARCCRGSTMSCGWWPRRRSCTGRERRASLRATRSPAR